MSEMTPTNEETFVELITNCPQDEFIILATHWQNNLISVYQIPKSQADEFNRMSDEDRRVWWKISFLAIAFHPEVWLGDSSQAERYR